MINIGSKIRDPTWHVGKIEPEKVPTQKVFIEATKSQIGDVTSAEKSVGVTACTDIKSFLV